MALKVFAIAILLFLAEIVFLTTKDFKDNGNIKKDIDFTDIAFENIEGYLITKDGVESTLKASQLLKYSQEVQIIDVQTNFLKKDLHNQITADYATLKGDIITLSGNASYENNESMQIKSQDLVYNSKTDIVSGTTPFTLSSLQGNIWGDDFLYDQKNGKIEVTKIRYESPKEREKL